MKRRKFIVFVSTFMFLASLLSFSSEQASAAVVGKDLHTMEAVTFEINGETVTFQDVTLNHSGHILLPMRNLYEAIGAYVDWNKETRTATALRNGKTVEMTIGSTVAAVDGKSVTVKVPPLMYKDRTYIPLRFVSENLDGVVNWYEDKQKVEVILSNTTTNPKPVPSDNDKPYILYLNNKKIDMTDPVIINNGKAFIPADYFYHYLEDATWKWLSDKEFELQIAGLSFIFTDGDNHIVVNDSPILADTVPFIKDNKMYVPVQFIVNALGESSSLRYMSTERKLYIYLDQFMFKSEFLEKSYGPTEIPQPVPSAKLEGNRQILVSDNPENLTPELITSQNATLAEHVVTDGASSNEHRVFGWHINKLGKNINLGITIQNTSEQSSIQVVNARGVVRKSSNDWYNYDVGLPLADQVLTGSMRTLETSGMIIKPGETVVIDSFELGKSYISGFVHDFDIRTLDGTNSNYVIRTVMTQNDSDLSKIHTEQVRIDSYAAHPRGVWPQSTIVADLPAYTVGSPEVVGYNISNGKTDHLLTAENSLSKVNGAMSNPGHFGMVYKVNIPIENPTGENQEVRIKMTARGGMYNGAVKMNDKVYLIPSLNSNSEFVYLPDHIVTGSSDTITLEIMHAGGVFLPAAIYIESSAE